jgi:hypothetical protein
MPLGDTASHLLGAAFQAFYVAALPMRRSVGVVESFDATLSKGTTFYGFAGQLGQQKSARRI